MNCNQLFRIGIWFTTLLLLNVECQCPVNVDDPEWRKQWYLKNLNTYEFDMNVMPAWESCVNGSGVTVGVVDKGIQDHTDLNIDRSLNGGVRSSYQNQHNQRTPQSSRDRYLNGGERSRYQNSYHQRTPQLSRERQLDLHYRRVHRFQESLKHGTRVAGIVAAKKNQEGTIGIAFGSKIADVKIASSAVFEHFNARLLRHRCETIDIYSCSFANFHTGTKTYPLLPEQKSAFEYGTTHGRGNLGSVYVFATGNSGGEDTDTFRDSCAYDRLVTNRYVISVAGIQRNLQKIPNGEACSAMMVSAFTAKAGARTRDRLITTDIGSTTTDNFNQNSAAAPMVSGAVALALSANPALTYRDIMHLLVHTSRSDLTNQYKTNFFRNAAGIYVSSYFGFGLLDIGKLVDRSKTWVNVPRIRSCGEQKTFNSPLNSDSRYFMVEITGCSATYIEHVEVSLKVNHQHAGQIEWVLVSPYGTKSIILPGRGLDPTENMDITVLTVQLWGENPNGFWKIEPTARFGKTLDHGTVKSIDLSIHGHGCLGQHCLPPAQQGDGSWSNWHSWSQCTGSCGQGIKSRRRQCNDNSNLASCAGENTQTEFCQLYSCQPSIQPEIQSEITSSGCPSPASLPATCVEQCSSDLDCRGQAKCCYNGCGHTCETSRTRIKSNGCPSPASLTTLCVEHCTSDWNCGGQRKCCYNGCGHTCETSRTRIDNRRQWSEWSPCSTTCGYGSSFRTCTGTTHICRKDSQQTKPCNMRACRDCINNWDGCSRSDINWLCQQSNYLRTHCKRRCGLCW